MKAKHAQPKSGLSDGAAEAVLRSDEQLLQLDPKQITEYVHNPRRSQNPEYDRIKASIRAEGMDQPLVVTQRPGEQAYTVAAGGNSRLRILKELLAEGHAVPRRVACVHRPWSSEVDVLVAHLRENDLRGALTFIDKSLAILEAKTLLVGDGGACPTQDELSSFLGKHGYHLTQSIISPMEYAAERLLLLIPSALGAGLGRPQVERIRFLERITRSVWLEQEIGTQDEFDEAFCVLCKRYDSPEWDIELLRSALEAEMADRAEVNIQTVRMSLEQLLTRRSEATETRWTPDEWPVEPEFPSDVKRRAVAAEGGDPSDGLDRNTEEFNLPDLGTSETPPDDMTEVYDSDSDDAAAVHARAESWPHVTELTDLKSLRARGWVLASRLAERNGLLDLVEPLPRLGLGFMLRDVPDPALTDELDEDGLARVSMVWWHLAACAEVTVAPSEQIAALLSEESVLRRALAEKDTRLLFSSVWTLDPGHTGYRLSGARSTSAIGTTCWDSWKPTARPTVW